MENPLVAIRCATYNQSSYIAQCLDGFVMQKTTFPFIAIVHDDASTDGTADIVREYAQKYPDIIHPIFETENQYSKQDGSLDSIMAEAMNKTRAKYVAMCEGDDYWIDPKKLQKQVDFLEANTDHILCCHNVKIWDEKLKLFVNNENKLDISQSVDVYSYAAHPFIATASVVYRNEKNYELEMHRKCKNSSRIGDFPLFLYLAQYGKIYCMNQEMAVYRYNAGIFSTDIKAKRHGQCYTMLHAIMPCYESDSNLHDILQHDLIEHCIQLYLYNLSIDKAKANTYLQESLHIDKDETLVFLNKELGEQIPRFYTIQKNFNAIEQSIAYRIGSFLMTIPHYIKQWCKKE